MRRNGGADPDPSPPRSGDGSFRALSLHRLSREAARDTLNGHRVGALILLALTPPHPGCPDSVVPMTHWAEWSCEVLDHEQHTNSRVLSTVWGCRGLRAWPPHGKGGSLESSWVHLPSRWGVKAQLTSGCVSMGHAHSTQLVFPGGPPSPQCSWQKEDGGVGGWGSAGRTVLELLTWGVLGYIRLRPTSPTAWKLC